MLYEYFRVIGANDSVENYADLFTVVLRNDDFQEFDSKWDEIPLSMTQIPSDDILEGLYKLRIRESEKLKTVLESYNVEIHQKKLGPDYHRLKTMVKRSIEQDLRNRNFGARNGNYDRNAEVKNQGTKQRVQRILEDCWQWESNGQCSRGDNCSFRHDTNKRAKMTQPNPSPNSFMRQNKRNALRTRSPRGKSPSGRMSRLSCKDYLKGTCTNSFCEKWHPPECLFYKTKSGCRFGEKCSFAHRQVDEQPTKRSKKIDDESAVAMLKNGDWHGRGPVTDIRDQNPSLGLMCPGEPHQRSPNAPKFEDRSQEETEWQEQGARDAAWKLAKSVLKLKEQERATFFSPSENRCLPASTLKPVEREFVVDSGASMHMISKKDLSNAEVDTLTKSCSPTIVITANEEVQTQEEAIVYVKELEIFLTMKVLEDTPAVVSLGKFCDEHGYSYEWINGQKPHLIKNGIRIQCNTENFVPIVVPVLSTSSSSSFPSSTSMTPSRQEIDHPTSSSSSSTMTSSTVSCERVARQERRDLCGIDSYPSAVSSERVEWQERGDPCSSDIPEWLQEFRDSHASSSDELSLEPKPTRSVDLGKHSFYTHFPKDRNCEICQRTKITRTPCRRRIGRVVLVPQIFGVLISADHKVLSDNCESRNNHRYAVVVQDLATQ